MKVQSGRLRSAPDGSRVVTASSDNTARLWDAAGRKEMAVLRGHEDLVNQRRVQRRTGAGW